MRGLGERRRSMAQPFLFGTAYLMLLVHGVAVLFRAPLALRISYIVGPLTGMWNHGTTSELAKWADRVAMTAGLCVDLAYLRTNYVTSWVCLGAAIALYACAKGTGAADTFASLFFGPSVMLHALSHGSVTAAHVSLLYALRV